MNEELERKEFERIYLNGDLFNHETHFRRANGEYSLSAVHSAWCLWKARALLDDNDNDGLMLEAAAALKVMTDKLQGAIYLLRETQSKPTDICWPTRRDKFLKEITA